MVAEKMGISRKMGKFGMIRSVIVLGTIMCLFNVPQLGIENARADDIPTGHGTVKDFTDDTGETKILMFEEAGSTTLNIKIPANVVVTDAHLNLTGHNYLINGSISNSGQDFNSGTFNNLNLENDVLSLTHPDLKIVKWCPYGDNAYILGSNGFVTQIQGDDFYGIPTSETLNFTACDWRFDFGENSTTENASAVIIASDGMIDETDYGARVYCIGINRSISEPLSIDLPTTEPGSIDCVQLQDDASFGILSGTYYPSGSSSNMLLYKFDRVNNTISLLQNEDNDYQINDLDKSLDNLSMFVTTRDFSGNLSLFYYDEYNDSLTLLNDSVSIGNPRLSVRPQNDYGLIIGTPKDIVPESDHCEIYKYYLENNTLINIQTSYANLNDIAWDPTGTKALICGENGILMLFTNSTSEFDSLTTDTNKNLVSVDWNRYGTSALIVGVDGTVLRYENGGVTNLSTLHFSKGIYNSQNTYTQSPVYSVCPQWFYTGSFYDTIQVSISNDGGQSWHDVENNSDLVFETPTSQLCYKIGILPFNTSSPPTIDSIALNYKMIGNRPSDPNLNIGNDATYEWSHDGQFSSTDTTNDLSGPINSYIQNAIPDLDGNILIPFVFHSSSQGVIEVNNISVIFAAAELGVSSIYFSQPYTTIGQAISITANILNSGDLNATGVLVELLINDDIIDDEEVNINANDISTVTFYWMPSAAGYKDISIAVDSSNIIGEYSKLNNSLTEKYFVASAVFQDFTIPYCSSLDWSDVSICMNNLSMADYSYLSGNNLNLFITNNIQLGSNAMISIHDSSVFYVGTSITGENSQIILNHVSFITMGDIDLSNSGIYINNASHIIFKDVSIDDTEFEIHGSNTQTRTRINTGDITMSDYSDLSINLVTLETLNIESNSAIATLTNSSVLVSGNIVSNGINSEIDLSNTSVVMKMNDSYENEIDITNNGALQIEDCTLKPSYSDMYYEIICNSNCVLNIKNSTITNATVEIYSDYSQISYSDISGANNTGILYNNNICGFIDNSTIGDNIGNDLQLESGANIMINNTKFDLDKTQLSENAILTSQWGLTVGVKDMNGDPLESAYVTIRDNTSSDIWNGYSNSSGMLPYEIMCKEFVKSYDCSTYYTPYVIEAECSNTVISNSADMVRERYVELQFHSPVGGRQSTNMQYNYYGQAIRQSEGSDEIEGLVCHPFVNLAHINRDPPETISEKMGETHVFTMNWYYDEGQNMPTGEKFQDTYKFSMTVSSTGGDKSETVSKKKELKKSDDTTNGPHQGSGSFDVNIKVPSIKKATANTYIIMTFTIHVETETHSIRRSTDQEALTSQNNRKGADDYILTILVVKEVANIVLGSCKADVSWCYVFIGGEFRHGPSNSAVYYLYPGTEMTIKCDFKWSEDFYNNEYNEWWANMDGVTGIGWTKRGDSHREWDRWGNIDGNTYTLKMKFKVPLGYAHNTLLDPYQCYVHTMTYAGPWKTDACVTNRHGDITVSRDSEANIGEIHTASFHVEIV